MYTKSVGWLDNKLVRKEEQSNGRERKGLTLRGVRCVADRDKSTDFYSVRWRSRAYNERFVDDRFDVEMDNLGFTGDWMERTNDVN